MPILNIIECAYRATLEEQDDTILWLSRSLQNNGADVSILLRGNAVNYAAKQRCPPLAIGGSGIPHPADPNHELAQLQAKGATIYVLRDDLDQRGIQSSQLINGVTLIAASAVAETMEQYSQVWHW